METFVSAILGDLVSRSISFVVEKYYRRPGVEESLQRLHRVLLQIQTIVEDAERRHITNQGMLQQLKMMREGMYKGYYMLDSFKYQVLQEKAKDEVSDHSFALFRAKRFRFSTGIANMASGGMGLQELQKMLASLENIIDDMKEFVVFLVSYPPLCRGPYSEYLVVDKCMFGRHAEKERIINFLLEAEPPGATNLGVLPIIGSPRVGKSTLVANVCHEERVRNYFSSIVVFSGNDLKNGKLTASKDSGVIKHQSRSLIVIDFSDDFALDEENWRTLYSHGRHIACGSKIIITSRSESIAKFGTTQALKLKTLPQEAYWHFFKVIAFGSTNPEEHPELAAIAMEIALLLNGSFLGANILGTIMRSNLHTHFWSKIHKRVRDYIQKHICLFGERPEVLLRKNKPIYVWRLPKSPNYFVLYKCYQTYSPDDQVPRVMVHEVQTGIAKPRGKFEALVWRSHIPPYYNYLWSCVIPTPQHTVIKKKRSKERSI